MSDWKQPRFILCKEVRGYSVWSIGLSGSKQDCYGHFTSKSAALRVLRALRRQAENV